VVLALSVGAAGVGHGAPVAAAAGDVGVWKVCPPGWNLVAGPDGSRLALHGEPLLLLDGDQETFAQSDSNAAQAGQGYWVYYPQGAMLLLVGTPLDVSTVHIDAGHWATIGNSRHPSGRGSRRRHSPDLRAQWRLLARQCRSSW